MGGQRRHDPPRSDFGVAVSARHHEWMDALGFMCASLQRRTACVLAKDSPALDVPWFQAFACALSAASSMGGKGFPLLLARLSIP